MLVSLWLFPPVIVVAVSVLLLAFWPQAIDSIASFLMTSFGWYPGHDDTVLRLETHFGRLPALWALVVASFVACTAGLFVLHLTHESGEPNARGARMSFGRSSLLALVGTGMACLYAGTLISIWRYVREDSPLMRWTLALPFGWMFAMTLWAIAVRRVKAVSLNDVQRVIDDVGHLVKAVEAASRELSLTSVQKTRVVELKQRYEEFVKEVSAHKSSSPAGSPDPSPAQVSHWLSFARQMRDDAGKCVGMLNKELCTQAQRMEMSMKKYEELYGVRRAHR